MQNSDTTIDSTWSRNKHKDLYNWHAQTWYSGTSFIKVDWVLKTNYLPITNPVLLVILLNVPEDLNVQAQLQNLSQFTFKARKYILCHFFQLPCAMKISSL